jgi:hypothetical protein
VAFIAGIRAAVLSLSAAPDLRSEAMKRACWERKPLPPEVLVDALQDRCHEDRPSRLTPFEQFLREGK